MLDPNTSDTTDLTLQARLAQIGRCYPQADPNMVAEVVRAMLGTMRGDLVPRQTELLGEIEELGRIISEAKSEIAAVRADEINANHIPLATDELDAIVAHTAAATDSILETCETLDRVAADLQKVSDSDVALDAAVQLQDATTRIYEACGFQDITGQRISKVVIALKLIEDKVAQIVKTFGGETHPSQSGVVHAVTTSDEANLLNGPQLPATAMDQTDIDKLLASFD